MPVLGLHLNSDPEFQSVTSYQKRTVAGRIEAIGVYRLARKDNSDLGITFVVQEVRRLHSVELIPSVIADWGNAKPVAVCSETTRSPFASWPDASVEIPICATAIQADKTRPTGIPLFMAFSFPITRDL